MMLWEVLCMQRGVGVGECRQCKYFPFSVHVFCFCSNGKYGIGIGGACTHACKCVRVCIYMCVVSVKASSHLRSCVKGASKHTYEHAFAPW